MEITGREGGERVHLGSGIEKEKMSPFLEALDRVLSGIDSMINRASEILLLQHRNDKKFLETMSRIDFEYVSLLLKKLLQKVAQVEKHFQPEDFYLDKDSVFYNKGLQHVARAVPEENLLEVNFNQIVKRGGELSKEERYILFELVATIIHEAIHLLAKKDDGQKITTGFLSSDKRQNEALNEGMTQIIALAVTRSYFSFKKDFKGEMMSLNAYDDEIKHLFALMILIARDTDVSLDAVIQSFTVSYFHGDDVLNSLLEFGEMSSEAKALIDKLRKPVPKSKKSISTFNEEELGNDQKVKDIFTALLASSPSRIVASALKL
jgi:hypothetical protein